MRSIGCQRAQLSGTLAAGLGHFVLRPMAAADKWRFVVVSEIVGVSSCCVHMHVTESGQVEE